MAVLGNGINANNNLLSCTRDEIQDLKNKIIDISMIANTKYDVDGTVLRFYPPIAIEPTAQLKSNVTDTCSHEINCVTQEDFDVSLDYWQSDFFAFATCATNMLSSQRIASALASYVKGWTNNEVKSLFSKMVTDFPAFTTATENPTVIEITEEMIVALEEKGFSREDIVVTYSSKASSEYRKIYQACCELGGTQVTAEGTANVFGVQNVINAKNFQTVDVIVYVKEYVLFGNYCRLLPEIWDGVDSYRGRSIIGGEEGYGMGIYDSANSGYQYVLA